MFKGIKILLMILTFGALNLVVAQRAHFPAIGIGNAVIFQQNKWNPGYAVELQCELGEMMDYIFLVPYAAYWNAEKSETRSGITRTLRLNDINFGSELLGYLSSKPQGVFTGVGIGYHIIMVDRRAPSYFNPKPEINEETVTKLSAALLLGYQLKISAFSVAVKLKYFLINGGFNTFQTGFIFSYNF